VQLTILLEDNHILAIAKPPGLLTQGVPAGVPTLEAMAKAYLKEKYHKPGNVYLGIPHRLDRPVSGVVLFARNSKAAGRLAEQFEKRQVRKIYWALVAGRVEPAEGAWDDWLRKLPDEARAELAAEGSEGAKRARLRYQCLRASADWSHLEVVLETGRMHQIRVQAASRGHPVLGDALYGSTRPFGPPAELPREQWIALHARSLTFLHPLRYEPVTLTAPPPDAWHEFIGESHTMAASPDS
jgi:23S rRNA pseudouridine1911/1915/1917 synthase